MPQGCGIEAYREVFTASSVNRYGTRLKQQITLTFHRFKL